MTNVITQKHILEAMLTDKCNELFSKGILNIKEYEYAFQEVIEKIYPERPWWKTTDCQIFMNLFEYKDPKRTIKTIIKLLKEN